MVLASFLASFAVKLPMWPVHTWLPDAHIEAATAGSDLLAGILLKIRGYGFLRFSLPMFPDASHYFAPLMFALSIIAIIYTSLVALVQENMKKLIAYSSVAHMGFVTMGLFAVNTQGVQGAVYQMVSHGLVSGALFLCVGVVYDRMHTFEIAAYGGLVNRMPRYAVAFMVFTLANIGLPGTSGFIGEFLTLIGAFQAVPWVALFAATGLHPVGTLCSLSLPSRHIRRARQAEPDDHTGLERTRDRGPHTLAAADALLRRAPAADHRRQRGVDRRPGAGRQSCDRDDKDGGALRVHVRTRNPKDALPMNATALSLPVILPEFILAFGILALILLGALRGERSVWLVTEGAVALLGVALVVLLVGDRPEGVTFYGAFTDDAFARFMKALALIGSLATLLLSIDFMRATRSAVSNFPC